MYNNVLNITRVKQKSNDLKALAHGKYELRNIQDFV